MGRIDGEGSVRVSRPGCHHRRRPNYTHLVCRGRSVTPRSSNVIRDRTNKGGGSVDQSG